MSLILKASDSNKISELKKNNGKLVLIGGCFDILHPGHLEFIKKAKDQGDKLIILLESNTRIKILKGKNRPINNQQDRAKILSAIEEVDYIIYLPNFKSDREYEKLVKQIQPDIIAVTHGTKVFNWEKKLLKTTKLKIVEVMEKKKNYSTSNLIKNKIL